MSGIWVWSESESESENVSEEIGLPSGRPSPSGLLARPIGICPSRERRFGTFVGQNWPPALEAREWKDAPYLPAANNTFGRLFSPGSVWAADFYPIVILAEFLATHREKWSQLDLPGVGANAAAETNKLREELKELEEIMDYRPGMVSEALAQANGILNYFRGVFTFTAKSHPMTFALGTTAIRIGEFLAMYYKARVNRPRPSRLSPRLMPSIEVPSHAAYPSGHATQSRLAAKLLGDVMPPEAELSLLSLAERIARNREVMGLHYRSDSEGGVNLADQTFALLQQCDTVKLMITQARHEWGRV